MKKYAFLCFLIAVVAIPVSAGSYRHNTHDDDRNVRRGSVDDRRYSSSRHQRAQRYKHYRGKKYYGKKYRNHRRAYSHHRHHHHIKRPRYRYWRSHYGECFRIGLNLDDIIYISVPVRYCH